METAVIDFLNNYVFSLGTLLAILVVGGGLIVSLLKLKKSYDKKIGEEATTRKEQKEFQDSMIKLADKVDEIQNHLITTEEENKKNLEESNKKFTELFNAMVQFQKESNDEDTALEAQITEYKNEINLLSTKTNNLDEKINILIESDKESLKYTITCEYYKAVFNGYIEIHTLQSLEAIYEKYLSENGNTFIGGLMEELRKLPHNPPKKNTTQESQKPKPKKGFF